MTASGPLRLATIGTGTWGRNHVRVLAGLPSARLVVCCDAVPGKAAEVGAPFGVDGVVNQAAVLQRPDVDAVVICTPPSTHFALAAEALRAGKHVFVEKPMTVTAADARGLVRLAADLGLRLMPGFIERYNPVVTAAIEAIGRGAVGRPVVLRSRRSGPRPPWVTDVGVVHDLAVHDIDLAAYLFGAVDSVWGRVGASDGGAHEDYAAIAMAFADGDLALIEADWLGKGKDRRVDIVGTVGRLRLDLAKGDLALESDIGVAAPKVISVETLVAELSDFVSGVRSGHRFRVEAIDGQRAVEVCEEVTGMRVSGCTEGCRRNGFCPHLWTNGLPGATGAFGLSTPVDKGRSR